MVRNEKYAWIAPDEDMVTINQWMEMIKNHIISVLANIHNLSFDMSLQTIQSLDFMPQLF